MTSPAAELDLPMEELLELVGSRFGDLGSLRSSHTEANGFATKVSSFFVTLTFTRSKLELFVKRADHATSAPRPDPPDLEARLYAALDGDEAFATPPLVGTIESEDRWLVLMRAPGWDLRYQSLELWHTAARALGRMHASFASRVQDPDYLSFLPRRDHDRNIAEAQLAFEVLRRHHPGLMEILDGVERSYEDVAAELAQGPLTLVHGDLAPKNVLVDTDRTPTTTVFVDWEWATVGPGLTDVADLINGLDAPTAESMFHSYVEAARGTALPPEDRDIERSMHLSFLQRLMFRFTRSVDWGVDADLLRQWATDAAAHAAEL